MTAKRWTKEEDEILRRHMRDHDLGWECWKDVLPGRSKQSINYRRSKLMADARSSSTVTGVYRGGTGATWGDDQRTALRKGVAALVSSTGHTLAQCVMEHQRMEAAERARRKTE